MQIDINTNMSAFNEWVEYRDTNFKKPMSDLAKQKCINKLSKYSFDVQQAAVDKAINNDWKDVYPAKITEDDLAEVRQERIIVQAETKSISFIETHTDTSWADNVIGIESKK